MGDSYTIQISSKLVNRLASDGEKPKKKTKKPKPKISRESHRPQSTTKPVEPPMPKNTVPTGGWPIQPPMFLPPPLPPPPPPPSQANAELEAIRSVLQESERVLEKLEKQEGNMVQELTQRAKDLRNKEFKLPYQKPMPCIAQKQACVECYKEHAEEPLRCAQAVKAFVECTRLARQQVGSAPGK